MTKAIKRKPEVVWMAWSPQSNYLPQAASVSKAVCKQMIDNFGWRMAKPVRVLVTSVKPKPRRRASQ